MAQKIKQGIALLGTIEAPVNAANSGSNEIVAAVADRRIRVTQVFFVVDSAVTVQARSAANNLTGAMSFAANGGIVLPYNEQGWFTTNRGEAFNLNLGGAVGVRGALKYDLIV